MKTLLLALAVSLALTGCNRDGGSGGPMEKAGREADKAIGQAGKAVEKAGRNMQDAAKGKEAGR